MKLFRKIDDGVNPDVEVSRYLTDRKFASTPAFAGSLEYRVGKQVLALGILQEFVPAQSDAWTYTIDHIKGYYDAVLEKAKGIHEQNLPGEIREVNPQEHPRLKSVGDLIDPFFLEKMQLLGRRTAQMHSRLASETDNPDFQPEPFSLLYQRSIFQSMGSQARHVFATLRQQLDKLAPEVVGEAVPVLEVERQIHDKFKEIIRAKLSAKKIRVHGDYHLGQVLFTGKDFIIIDFEGEPARPLSERRLKRSALRDVAGMIRSFHYAVYATLFLNKSVRHEDVPVLEYAADTWYTKVSRVFLDAYFEQARQMDFLPVSQEEREFLLMIYLLDKAVYELGYELNNRPAWTIIPLRGILSSLKSVSGS
jgi:maltose alpha-D-glucosyltransferase/alpha-amylase